MTTSPRLGIFIQALGEPGTVSRVSKAEAKSLLEDCIGPDAEFRPDQWEAIHRLVNKREQLLLVQRTGWGKSTVYFIATRCLRNQGAGPTLIISPLLSLMRNQIQDAEADLGLDAVTINSNNTDEWEEAKEAVVDGTCDIVLISPERLANHGFRSEVLAEMEQRFGMLVVDEAHCISDWGHDFRPDYRRIKGILKRLPDEIPVAATTATANDRVVEDITSQLPGLSVIRGSLVRESLHLQTIRLDERERRLAWLAANIGDMPLPGIIYCLTRKDVEIVADWLTSRGFDARSYHGRLEGETRDERESLLMENEVDVLVATNALGMGFNKPDLGTVIHFQRPPNLIRYYQEIGRAGRGLEKAYAILLAGEEDDDIAEYFIESAFPSPDDFKTVLQTIEASEEPLYRYEILKRVDVASGDVGTCLNILRVDGAIRREDDGFIRTGESWKYDFDRTERVTNQRWHELDEIKQYVRTDDCLLRFIDDVLDGSMVSDCGKCANCQGPLFSETVPEPLADEALEFYRSQGRKTISPRKRWPEKEGTYRQIGEDELLEPGRALSVLGAPGWGRQVEACIDKGHLDAELVEAGAQLVEEWAPDPWPAWVTGIPSTAPPGYVADYAERLADRLDLSYADVIEQTGQKQPQAELANSYQQCWNVEEAFKVSEEFPDGPVLLVDDVVGSRWTLTVVGTSLRKHGCPAVHPLVLADRRG